MKPGRDSRLPSGRKGIKEERETECKQKRVNANMISEAEAVERREHRIPEVITT